MGRITQNPSLQLIADQAGVSRSTVSLALRNQQCIAQATRDRIHKVALEAGYRPNPLVSTLMAHIKSQRPLPDAGAIGFITNFSARDDWRQFSIFVRYFEGASERARQMGYHLDEMWAREPGMTARKMESILYNRGVDGLLLAPLPNGIGHLSLDVRGFAAATLGFSLARPNLHRASSNHVESARLALRKLRRKGYRRVGLAVNPWQDKRSNSSWTAEYLAFQQPFPPSGRIPIHHFAPGNPLHLARWINEWKPDAILTGNSTILPTLAQLGIAVPDDLGVAVMDLSTTDADIAGIDQQPEIAAAAAVDLIIGQIQRNERGVPAIPKLTLTGGVWVDGGTLRDCAPTPRVTAKNRRPPAAAPGEADASNLLNSFNRRFHDERDVLCKRAKTPPLQTPWNRPPRPRRSRSSTPMSTTPSLKTTTSCRFCRNTGRSSSGSTA